MNVTVNYDVSSKHVEVKKKMKALGYRDYVVGDAGTTCYLPNTTLFKDTEIKTALQDITNVAAQLGVNLQRAIACNSIPWTAIPGEKHSE